MTNDGGDYKTPGGTSQTLYDGTFASGGEGSGGPNNGQNGKVFIQYIDYSDVVEIIALDATDTLEELAIRSDINPEDRVFLSSIAGD